MQSCRYDQSAYISYLVDEAVRVVDNSDITPTSTQSPQILAPSNSFTPSYPVDFNFPRHTVAPNFPPFINASFNPQLSAPTQRLQLYSVPAQQNFTQIPGPAPNSTLPSSYTCSTLTNNLSGQQSQLTLNSPRYQTSSFCLNQHIGLEEPPVVNASQINNKIQVQFQFGDNDRFSVQSTNTTESNGLDTNWNNFGSNVSENQATTVDLTIPTSVQPVNVQTNSKCLSNSPADFGDFSQFCVSNILGKKSADIGNSTNVKGTIENTENVRHDSQAEAREYFNYFMQKEKEKEQLWTGSERSYNKSVVKYKPNSKTIAKRSGASKDTIVNIPNNRCTSTVRLPVNVSKVANEVKTVEDTQSAEENNRGSHEFCNLYYKEYVKLVKKQKAEKDNSKETGSGKSSKKSVPVKKRRSKVAKPSEEIKLLKLTYQCGDCLETYDNIKELKKHIHKNHKETKKAGEVTSEHRETGSILVDLTETEKIDEVDLTETEEIDEVSMTRESEEQEIMEVESENTNSGPQSYLCSYCGYDSKSKDESEEHQKTHKDELERDTIEIDCHREETEYFQMSQKLVERQKEGEEERKRKSMEERNRRDDEEALAKAKASEEVALQKRQSSPLGSKTKKVSDKNKTVSTLSPESAQESEDNRTLPKRRAATQAKNTLMNPSKGKQKRIRDTRSLNTEDKMLMERFGIIPSKVCLSRVQESENLEPPSLNSSSDDLGQGKRREEERNLEGDDNQITINPGIEKNHSNENMNMPNTENEDIVNSLGDEFGHERNDKVSNKDGNLEGEENQITRRNKVVGNHWNKVLNMCNIENAKENTPADMAFSDDDSDIEIVEPPMTLIVLDDEVEETATKKESPKKSDKEILKSYGLKDVTINMDKIEKSKENDSPEKDESRSRSDPKLLDKVEKTKGKGSPAKDKSRGRSDTGPLDKVEKSKENGSPAKDKSRSRSDTERLDKVETSKEKGSPAKDKSRSRSDTELLEKFGIKDLSVNLTNTPTKVKHIKPGPKSKTQTGKRQARESKSSANAAAKNIEEMSPNEIEKLLYECGMGISVPVQSQSTSDNGNKSNDKTQRTPSPVPSTSKGHGHLKRKRTARKSTKDSALFKEYKLKDSKVIIQNLSRIDVSLIRNPNSPFGKSDWLKHKFDSDSESDFEFDIPTPPLLEDFVDNTGPCRSNLKEQTVPTPKTGSPSKTGRKSPVKRKGLKAVETFGITDQVVVADSEKRKETSKAGVNKKKTLSDEELRRKFGIPNTMVVINTSEKTQGSINRESSDKTAAEKTPNYISFADFKSALDSARKNILSRMKTDDFSKKEIETENELPRKTRRRADNIEENVVQSPKRHKVEVTGKFKENIKTENDSPRKTRRKADDIKDKDVHSLKRHNVEVTGNVKECRDTDVSTRKTRRKADNVEVVHSLKRHTVKGKLNKNFEQKDNKKGRNEKETYAQPNVNKRNLRPASQLNERLSGKILPSKLKTLTVDIHKLKLNEALKTYKAKAVSRAIEARHKKNKNLREVNKGNAEQINIHNERTTSSARKRSRSKEPDILTERSVKRKRVDFKEKPKGIKQLNFERQIQVVKTARYRRAVPEKETVGKPVRTCDFKKLTKGLPVVKISVPCLTNEDILRLSQSTEETRVSSSQVASQIVYEIIDKICFAEEVPDKTVLQIDSDSEMWERNANCTSIEGGESNAKDNSMESVSVNSGEIKSVQESSNEKENIENKPKENSNEAITTDESESDLSLISVTFENKGSENNVPAPFYENKDDSGENKNIDTENDNDIAEMEKTSVNKIDIIPLGKSKFYDEDLKENSLDEVDGDIVDGTEMSLADDDETALNIIDEKEKNICEMKTKHEDANLSMESLNHEEEHIDSQGKTAKMVDCRIDETEVDDASAEKENRSEKENSLSKVHYVENVEKELNDIELANTLKSYDEGDVSDSKDKSASVVKQKQVLSAIIDSESGSLIGDVYSVDELAGSSSEGGPDKKLHKKENDSTDNCSRESRSRSTTPDDVIETITES